MKLVPFDKDPAVLRLAVVTVTSFDMPCVAAVDQSGKPLERGTLLKITPEGYDPVGNVDPKLGLPLDKQGRFVRVGDADDVKGVAAALKEVKHWITNDNMYHGNMSLNECSASDRLHVTVGQLRIIVNALEKRL